MDLCTSVDSQFSCNNILLEPYLINWSVYLYVEELYDAGLVFGGLQERLEPAEEDLSILLVRLAVLEILLTKLNILLNSLKRYFTQED